MKVNLKCVEAKNIPKVDLEGTCDGYCKIQFGQQKVKTRIIDNSLTPHWRQEFFFDVLDIQKDYLFIQLYDHDKLSKDDLIADLEIYTQFLQPGIIIDKWYTMNPIIKDKTPQIHLVIHIGQEKDTPFIPNPFQILVTNIRIISAKDIEEGEYSVSVGYKKNLMKETRISDDLMWQEEFALAMPLDEPNLIVNLNKGKNIIGKTKIFIGYPVGEIEKKYFPLEGKGNLKLAIQVAPNFIQPFLGEKFDDLPPPTEFTAYFRIIEGKSLTAMDLNGKNDAYCTVVNLKTPKKKKKTQILYKTKEPKWNYFLSVKIHDYSSDEIKISCYDYDKMSKDDLIGYIILPVREMGDGKIIDKWVNISNPESGTGGQLHLMYQICTIGWTPFITIPKDPIKQIHIHVMDGYDIPKTDLIGKTDPYLKIKLNDQEFFQKTSVIDNTLTPLWNERITLYSLYSNPSIQLQLLDEAPGKDPIISYKTIELEDIPPGKVKELTEEFEPKKGMKKGGKIHLYIQITNDIPFLGVNFERHIDLGKKTKRGNGCLDNIEQIPTKNPLTLFIKIGQAFDLKSMDSNGLSDPYCVLKVNNQKKSTSIISECLNPKWDEYFIFELNSLAFDFLQIDCMDHNAIAKDALIGFLTIPIKSLKIGEINELTTSLKQKEGIFPGSLSFRIHIAQKGDIPFQEKKWTPSVFNIRILEGNFQGGHRLYWTGKFENDKDYQFLTTQKRTNKWMEEYQMIYSSKDKIIIKLFENKDKESEKGKIEINFNELKDQVPIDKTFKIGSKGSIHIVYERNYLGNPPFGNLPLINPNENAIISETFTFNIKIYEAKNIASMDLNGKSDPYIRLYLYGPKPKEKIGEIKTKIRFKTLDPYWNDEFQFPIKSIGTDILHMSLKDYDTFGRDDKISSYDIAMLNLNVGEIRDEWIHFNPEKGVTKSGLVHIKYQLTAPGKIPFTPDNTFIKRYLVVKVIEAKEIKAMNINGFSDPYCQMSILGDRTSSFTQVIRETLSPYWDKNYSFLLNNYEKDIFVLTMKNKNKVKSDEEIGSINLEVKQFEISKVYKKWFEIQKKGKKTGMIKILISVRNDSRILFDGEIIEDKISLPPSEKWEINVHLFRASELPSADSNGLSDPYCSFNILNTKIVVKSRRIDKNLNPIWDEIFRIPINSLNSDILRVEVIDWDKIGKHDKLGMIDFPLINYQPGIIYNNLYPLTPLMGDSKNSTIELAFQITPPGIIPFTNISSYIPDQINVRIEDINNVTTKNKKVKPYFNVRLEADTNEGLMSIVKDTLNCEIKECFSLIICDKNTDKLIIEYKDENDKNKILSKCLIPLSNFENEITKEMNIPMEPSGNIHLFLQINKKGNYPFTDAKLSPISNPYMTLYIKVISAYQVPVADSTGLSDPFCVLELMNRKEKKKTAIKKQTLTPVWNQEFQFKIFSFNTDVLILSLYDYDKFSKNDLLGEWRKPIKDMRTGIVVDEEINAGGKIHVIYQLACANQNKWENKELWPLKLHVRAIEAKEFPDNAGKTDPYLELSFFEDIIKERTKTLDNTLTPQWFQDFHFLITDLNEPFLVKLWDENVLKNSQISQKIINFSQNFKLNTIYDEWYDLSPIGSYKKGGKVRLMTQITDYYNEPFVGPKNPPPPFPISETKMLFNIKIIRAEDVEIMDTRSSDPYCKLEFVGFPDSVKKTRIIENSLNPFWDEFFQYEIPSLSDIFKITLYDYDKLTKDDIISEYTIDLSKLEYGIVKEEEVRMNPYSSSIRNPGIIELKYQITQPCQEIFVSKKFEINTLKCYIYGFENTIEGEEYFCEVKNAAANKGQLSNVTNDNLLMETFILLLNPYKEETLEIILYHNERKGKHKFAKEIKRIKHKILEMGEKNIDGIKFTLALNDPNISFPPHPPMILAKRFVHIYVDRCINLPKMDKKSSDPFVKISLNKYDKIKRYSNSTRVIMKELNPVFKHVFHVPVYSLRDDKIKIQVFDYDLITKSDLIGKLEFKVSEFQYGIIKDEWYNLNKGKIHLITHLSDENQPSFVNKEFIPYYLHVKIYESEVGSAETYIDIHMKNDIFPKLNIKRSEGNITPQYPNCIFSLPISNKDDSYVIDTLNDLRHISHSNEFSTKGLQEGLIYRNIVKNLRFWTQILPMGEEIPFKSKNFYDYYNKTPEEKYTLHVEIMTLNKLKASDDTGKSDPYYIASISGQSYKSRVIYDNLNPIFYDEFKFHIKNLDEKFVIKIYDKDTFSRDDPLGLVEIDLTSEPFGKVVENDYFFSYSSITMKWQVTEPGQSRWSEKIFNVNEINLNIGQYESVKNNNYEFWVLKLDNMSKQTMITPCGAFNETFTFLLTDQEEIIFEKYNLDNNNYPCLVKKIPFNFSKSKNGTFILEDTLGGVYESVPNGTTPFDGKIFPLYFSPKPNWSISIFIYEARNLDGDIHKPPDPYCVFKYKDRDILNAKSRVFKSTKNPVWNQYFNFDVYSIGSDILQIYVMDKDKFFDDKLCKIQIGIVFLLDGKIDKKWHSVGKNGTILIQTQLLPPNINPFTNYTFSYDMLYIKIIEGQKLKFGDIYCSLKLSNDISFKKTRTIKNSQNPQWNEIISLPITDLSNYLEIHVKNENMLYDTSFGKITVYMNDVSTKTTKITSNLSTGSIIYLIQLGKSDTAPFFDYEEIDPKITANNLMLAVKILEAKNLPAADSDTSDPYCKIKVAEIEKRTRVIDCTLNPIWNELFYFDILSYSTNELSIKIYDKDKLSKDDLLYELTIPITKLKCGIVEDRIEGPLHFITHLMEPGQLSFDSHPFIPTSKTILLKNLSYKPEVYCSIRLKHDEYWRYTQIGSFLDFFKFEYVDNTILCIKSSNEKKSSEELNIDLRENDERVFENSFGKFEMKVVNENEIKPLPIKTFWTCNILVKGISNISKKKEIMWLPEINGKLLGYTYDGNINKYISLNINSIQTDEFKFILYKIKKGQKKEYGHGFLHVGGELQFGIIQEKSITFIKKKLLGTKITNKIININVQLTPPNAEPFINIKFNPLVMHVYLIEAINVPKMDLTSKSDPYVLFKFEKDKIGIKSKYLDNTLTPQWNQLIDLFITDSNENLFVELWDKNIKKDKFICSGKLETKKYMDYEPHYEWLKIDKVYLNLIIQIKPFGEPFITNEEVKVYQLSPIPNINSN